MEESVNEYLLQNGIGAICGNGLFFFGCMRLVYVIIQPDANDFFYGNDPGFGVIPKDPGDMDGGAVLKVLRNLSILCAS